MTQSGGWDFSAYTDEAVLDPGNDPALERRRSVEEQRLAQKRESLIANPFDPREEISADARHIADRIVRTLWVIFVIFPAVIGVLAVLVFIASRG